MKEIRKIESLQHPLVKHLVKLRNSSSYREEEKSLLLEGCKVIKETASISKLFYTPPYAAEASFFQGEKWEISEAILSKVSGMGSPEGMLAEALMPSISSLGADPRVLALDGISDPGNLGTLMRTALAFGWGMVYFLPGSCDPFNDKALRAAKGAHFKLVLARGSSEELQKWVEERGVQAWAADLSGERAENIEAAGQRLLVLGNESRGLSKNITRFCNPVSLPMTDQMESLNVAVAGGILLYLLNGAKGG